VVDVELGVSYVLVAPAVAGGRLHFLAL
jgi:hypothetical protein